MLQNFCVQFFELFFEFFLCDYYLSAYIIKYIHHFILIVNLLSSKKLHFSLIKTYMEHFRLFLGIC